MCAVAYNPFCAEMLWIQSKHASVWKVAFIIEPGLNLTCFKEYMSFCSHATYQDCLLPVGIRRASPIYQWLSTNSWLLLSASLHGAIRTN